MTTGPDHRDTATPTSRCRVCGISVPPGRFCAACGARLTARRGDGPDWLRAREYGAAPTEYLLRPSVVSTVFPQLPKRSRAAFGVGLLALLFTMAIFVVLHWQIPVIAVATLGFPLLLAIFLKESGVIADQSRGTWLLTVLLGVGLGIGWALLSGALVAHEYGIGLGAGVAGGPSNVDAIGVPLGGLLLMLVPAIVMRFTRSTPPEALGGFAIGVVGATCFGAAATLVRLAPQFAAGLVAPHRPVVSLVVEVGIRGVAIPLTSAAIGGLAGIALWFTRRGQGGDGHRRGGLAALAGTLLVVVAVGGGNGFTDAWSPPQITELFAHWVITAVALMVLRVVVHLALLHEAQDPIEIDTSVPCPECELKVPEAAFCPNCGVASRASSRSSRIARRGLIQGPEAVQRPSGGPTSSRRLLVLLGSGLAVVVTAMVGVSLLVTKPVAQYACPPDCGRPPTGNPVQVNPRFTAADGVFSVSHPAPGSAYEVTSGADGVVAVYTGGDGGMLRLLGEPAAGRTPRQVVRDLLKRTQPDATTAYEIPNAMVGYQLGYGEVDDDYPQSASGSYLRLRIVALAAVKNDYALIAAAIGPFRQFGPDFGPGPPSAVNLELAMDMDKYVNSFSWRGDPAR